MPKKEASEETNLGDTQPRETKLLFKAPTPILRKKQRKSIPIPGPCTKEKKKENLSTMTVSTVGTAIGAATDKDGDPEPATVLEIF